MAKQPKNITLTFDDNAGYLDHIYRLKEANERVVFMHKGSDGDTLYKFVIDADETDNNVPCLDLFSNQVVMIHKGTLVYVPATYTIKEDSDPTKTYSQVWKLEVKELSKERMCLTKRDFNGEEFHKWALSQVQEMNQFRNEVSKRRPTDEEKELLKLNKPLIKILNKMTDDYVED